MQQHFCVDGVGSNEQPRRHWTHICSFQTVKTTRASKQQQQQQQQQQQPKIETKNTNLENIFTKKTLLNVIHYVTQVLPPFGFFYVKLVILK